MKRATLTLIIALLAVLLIVSASRAQTGAGSASADVGTSDTYSIDWYSVDGGGAMDTGGGAYSLSGTIGQADAGTLSGSGYTLSGGFWGGISPRYFVDLPLLQR